MNVKKYVGDVIGGSLFVAESRVLATLLLEKPTEEEFKFAVQEDNILQKRSPLTAARYASTIRARLTPMGDEYLAWLERANEEVARQLLFAFFLHNSPLAADFMRTAVKDAHHNYQDKLSDSAWLDFIDDRVRVLPELGKFSESSIQKMGNNVLKAMKDVGYVKSVRNKVLQAVYIDPDVRAWLENNDHGGLIAPMEATLQIAFDSGGRRLLLPMASASDIPTVPAELFAKFQISFYSDPVDAVYKALGVH